MPYEFVPDHPECDSGEGALVQEETREFLGCHSDEGSAMEQAQAIEANKQPDPMESDVSHLVGPHGGTLKDLDDKGTFGGYLIQFGGPKEHDLELDFFTKGTDYWLDGKTGQSAVLWAHGTDPKIGKKRIDASWGTLAMKDAGIWLETQLQKRNEYEEAIHKLAEKGKLGLSSGTASHLVERERTKEGPSGVTHVKQWPLGLDASPTPTPAEPRTNVQPLKSVSVPSINELMNFGVQGKAENIVSLEEAMGQMKAISLKEKKRLIKADFRSQFENEGTNQRRPRVKAIFEQFVLARGRGDERGKMYRISYSGSVQEGYTFAGRSDWTEVVKTETFTERSVAKGVKEKLAEINEQFFGDRNGPDDPGKGNGAGTEDEDLESTLASLAELTS